jgi:hypothetical protein
MFFCIFFFGTTEGIGVRSHFLTFAEIPFENARFLHLLFCTNKFSNYRILTPSLPAFPVPHGDFFRDSNYPFSTPRFGSTSDG